MVSQSKNVNFATALEPYLTLFKLYTILILRQATENAAIAMAKESYGSRQ